MIQVLIRPQFQAEVQAEFVEQVARIVLEQEFPFAEADLSVVITDDAEVQSLNLRFSGSGSSFSEVPKTTATENNIKTASKQHT